MMPFRAALHALPVFGESVNCQVPLQRLKGARVLWVAPDARDPARWREGARELHPAILDSCGFGMANLGETDSGSTDADPESVTADAIGVADRYGGAGLGFNGGSGRAVHIGGFYVKGVGRTPLLGARTDSSHATGVAFMAECVREVFWSQLVARHFPDGAVRVLALIDTGRTVRSEGQNGREETLCLLVRESFVRPAHFERAPLFTGEDGLGGVLDEARVQAHARAWDQHIGAAEWQAAVRRCVLAWSRQLGYAFAHRIGTGAATTSNIDLMGRIADFGGFRTLPSWGRYELAIGDHPFGMEMQSILTGLHSMAARGGHGSFDGAELQMWLGRCAEEATVSYAGTVVREVLWLAGLEDNAIERCLSPGTQVAIAVWHVIKEQQSLYWPVKFGVPPTAQEPGVARLWTSERAPLQRLAAQLRTLLTVDELNEAVARCPVRNERPDHLDAWRSGEHHYRTFDEAYRQRRISAGDLQQLIDDAIAGADWLGHQASSGKRPC